MLDFNKRKPAGQDDEAADREPVGAPATGGTAGDRGVSASGRRESAIIGPSIHIDGDLRGEEDLIIEGEVKGTVNLKKHSLTIGGRGKVTADVYANSIAVDGFMEGDLFGAERVVIRKTAVVRGNITSPRVSLEDGAKFRGSIEMDDEALKTVFAEGGRNAGQQSGQGAGKAGERSATATAPGGAAGSTGTAGGRTGG